MNDYSEDNLKKAADLYAEAYGKSLLTELDDMRAQRVSYMTPRADQVVRDLSRMNKSSQRRRVTGILATIAACLVIAIAIPQIMEQGAVPDSGTPDVSDVTPEPALIDWAVMQPLSFTLPDGFEIGNSELDNEMSIYSLDSNNEIYPDNVVLTMQQPDDGKVFQGAETIYIDDKPVSTKLDEGYKMLLFEKDGKLYTLTCKDDMGTLTYLYRCIEGEQI